MVQAGLNESFSVREHVLCHGTVFSQQVEDRIMAKKFLAALVAVVVMVTTAAKATAADKVRGDYIDVAIGVEGKTPARLFEPIDTDAMTTTWYGLTTRYRYVHLEKGDVYSINVTPRNGERYGVAVAVDGWNVMHKMNIPTDGYEREAMWRRHYRIMSADTGNSVTGWQEETVATIGADTSVISERKFKVSSDVASLANRTFGEAGAVGSILVVVFREEIENDDEAVMKGGFEKDIGVRGLGTTAGERVYKTQRTVEFRSRPVATEVFVILYASKPELKELGVWTEPTPLAPRNRLWPQAKSGYGRLPE